MEGLDDGRGAFDFNVIVFGVHPERWVCSERGETKGSFVCTWCAAAMTLVRGLERIERKFIVRHQLRASKQGAVTY